MELLVSVLLICNFKMLIQLGCQDENLPSLNLRSAVLSPKTSTPLPTAIPVQGIAQVLAKRVPPNPELTPWKNRLKVAFSLWNVKSTDPKSDAKRYLFYVKRLHRSFKAGRTDLESIVIEAELEASGPKAARGRVPVAPRRSPEIVPFLEQLNQIFENRDDPDQRRDESGDFKRHKHHRQWLYRNKNKLTAAELQARVYEAARERPDSSWHLWHRIP